LQCKDIPGVNDGGVLVADYSLRCGTGDHFNFAVLGVAFLAIYVLGIPAGIWCLLRKNRQHLHDTNSKKHNETMYKLGGLYSQYEEKYWVSTFVALLIFVQMHVCAHILFLFSCIHSYY
tara:strand:- start:1043 stop:1399 length:357 start_codon:yes stop_codon:yes gene_type:complete